MTTHFFVLRNFKSTSLEEAKFSDRPGVSIRQLLERNDFWSKIETVFMLEHPRYNRGPMGDSSSDMKMTSWRAWMDTKGWSPLVIFDQIHSKTLCILETIFTITRPSSSEINRNVHGFLARSIYMQKFYSSERFSHSHSHPHLNRKWQRSHDVDCVLINFHYSSFAFIFVWNVFPLSLFFTIFSIKQFITTKP